MKIGQYLAKICTRVYIVRFLGGQPVYIDGAILYRSRHKAKFVNSSYSRCIHHRRLVDPIARSL